VSGLPRRIEIESRDGHLIVALSEVEANPTLADSVFQLQDARE
jgi:hypothetical protein